MQQDGLDWFVVDAAAIKTDTYKPFEPFVGVTIVMLFVLGMAH